MYTRNALSLNLSSACTLYVLTHTILTDVPRRYRVTLATRYATIAMSF